MKKKYENIIEITTQELYEEILLSSLRKPHCHDLQFRCPAELAKHLLPISRVVARDPSQARDDKMRRT